MSFVEIDKPRPHVALVTLNRPERMNAMAFDVMIPLREALEGLSHDNDVRVVVLTGAGSRLLLGRRPRGRRLRAEHRRPDGHVDRAARARAPRRRDQRDPQDAPAGDRRDQRRRDRRWLLPRVRVRHPHRIRGRVLPAPRASTTDSPRASSASPISCRARSDRRARSTSCSRVATSTPRKRSASGSSRGRAGRRDARRVLRRRGAHDRLRASASRSPSGCCGRASTPPACTRTWTTKASRSSTCASRPRTSKRPSAPARRSAAHIPRLSAGLPRSKAGRYPRPRGEARRTGTATRGRLVSRSVERDRRR